MLKFKRIEIGSRVNMALFHNTSYFNHFIQEYDFKGRSRDGKCQLFGASYFS